jgi:hypothetical protein
MKRLIIATLSGVLFGFVCYGFASGSQDEFNLLFMLMLVLSRTMIGFAIGISRFPMGHWAVHGLVMGFIFSLPGSFGAALAPAGEFGAGMMFASSLIMGVIYGFLIELITTVIFKARMPAGG